MSALRLDGVSVSYRTAEGGPTLALDGVSIEVASGEVVAVVGPSGCGKSTLLRAIAGLEPLSVGVVRLDGRDLQGTPTHHRDLGLMFQDHALFPHLTVGDNIAFGLRMKHQHDVAQHQRVVELLAMVDLPDFAGRTVDQLSGGEAQRVALARAIAPSPGLLMLDEPLGSLDRVLREQLTGDLRRLINRLGLTALHVTHDQTEAFALADRVVVLRNGRVEQHGTPSEVWHRPASGFVARFLGHPNVWTRAGDELVVPLRAIAIDAAGARSGRVELIQFREGRFRVTARSTDEHPGELVVFESDIAPALESEVKLAVDEGSAWTVPTGPGEPRRPAP